MLVYEKTEPINSLLSDLSQDELGRLEFFWKYLEQGLLIALEL